MSALGDGAVAHWFRSVSQLGAAWLLTSACGLAVLALGVVFLGRPPAALCRPVLRYYGRTMLSLLGVRVVLDDREGLLAARRPAVVTFNHASLLDDFIVLSLMPDDGLPVVKREVLYYPIVGWAVAVADFLIVDRAKHGRAVATLQRGADRIRQQQLKVFIAPEGTRSADGSLGPFKLGAFHLALISDAPIVPMVIEGAGRLQPKGRYYVSPGTVHVRFLAPLPPCRDADELRAQALALHALYSAALGHDAVS